MKETSLKPVIEKLENLFSKFNEKFYNGELQTPVITVSPDTTKGAYGWCTAWKAWSVGEQKKVADLATLTKEALEAMKKDDGFYEIKLIVCSFWGMRFSHNGGTGIIGVMHQWKKLILNGLCLPFPGWLNWRYDVLKINFQSVFPFQMQAPNQSIKVFSFPLI